MTRFVCAEWSFFTASYSYSVYISIISQTLKELSELNTAQDLVAI